MYPTLSVLGMKFSSYGVMALIGLLSGAALYFVSRKKYSLAVKDMVFTVLYAVVGAFIGAKLLFVIVEWDSVFAPGATVLSVMSSGYVFYGGLIGAALMLVLYAKKSGISLLVLTDSMLPCICVTHAVGRVGCFLAGCCYGCETNSPFGVYFPETGYAPGGIKILPTQLFEAVFLLVLAAVLFFMLSKQNVVGRVTVIYLFAYSVWRFIIEFYRMDERGSVGMLSTSQFISIFIFALGVLMIVFGVNNKHKLNKAKNKEIINNEKI